MIVPSKQGRVCIFKQENAIASDAFQCDSVLENYTLDSLKPIKNYVVHIITA